MKTGKLDPIPSTAYTGANRRPRQFASRMRIGGVLFSMLVAGFCITACQSTLTPTALAPSETLSPTATFPASTSSPAPLPIQTPTLPGLSSGVVMRVEIDEPGLEHPLFATIYLPPQYEVDPSAQFPVLYLLHGLLSNDQQWIELGVSETADALFIQRDLKPFIIVMPWEQNGGNFERAIIDHLIPYIDSQFRTRTQSIYRAIGGLSRGGGWAARIGLHYPETFTAIGLHSPANFTAAPYYNYWLNSAGDSPIPRIRIDIGDHDSLLPSTQELAATFDLLNIPYELTINIGNHVPAYWSANLIDYLQWYGEPWG